MVRIRESHSGVRSDSAIITAVPEECPSTAVVRRPLEHIRMSVIIAFHSLSSRSASRHFQECTGQIPISYAITSLIDSAVNSGKRGRARFHDELDTRFAVNHVARTLLRSRVQVEDGGQRDFSSWGWACRLRSDSTRGTRGHPAP